MSWTRRRFKVSLLRGTAGAKAGPSGGFLFVPLGSSSFFSAHWLQCYGTGLI